MAARGWATSITSSPLRSCRGWTARWGSSLRRTIRCAAITFSSLGATRRRRSIWSPLAQGKKIGAWSLTEPEAGSDAGGTKTTAVRDGNHWVLNGAKTFTTNGHYADVCVAMAVTDKSKGSHGISAFILEKGTPGFKPGKKENKLGMRASDTSESDFYRLPRAAGEFAGPEGEGFTGSLKILDGGRISIAALALGMAQGALEAATKYAKQRKQFGQAISEFQAIQFKLADMATEVEAARLLVYQAAWLADKGTFALRANRAWRNCLPAKWRCAWPMNACRFTAGTASSRTIRRRSFIAT